MQAAHHLASGSQREREDEAHWAVDPIIYRTECSASNGGDAMQGRQAGMTWMDGLVPDRKQAIMHATPARQSQYDALSYVREILLLFPR